MVTHYSWDSKPSASEITQGFFCWTKLIHLTFSAHICKTDNLTLKKYLNFISDPLLIKILAFFHPKSGQNLNSRKMPRLVL